MVCEKCNPKPIEASFNAGSCCDKASKAGKECQHPCCLAAAKAGKVCEKCNPPAKKVSFTAGSWDNYQGFNVWGGKNPENPAQFTGKSYGILSVQGTLYAWWGDGSDNHFIQETRVIRSSQDLDQVFLAVHQKR